MTATSRATCIPRRVPPEDGVQRGSVADMPVYRAIIDAGQGSPSRRALSLAMPRRDEIPVLPSPTPMPSRCWRAGGQVVPQAWRGALPLLITSAPDGQGASQVISNWDQKPVYDVVP